MKNAEMMFIENSAVQKKEAGSTIIYSVSLYPESVFPKPVVLCAAISLKKLLPIERVFHNVWGDSEICSIDIRSITWKLEKEPDRKTVTLQLEDKADLIRSVHCMFFDLLSIKDKAHLKTNVVEPVLSMYKKAPQARTADNEVLLEIPPELLDV